MMDRSNPLHPNNEKDADGPSTEILPDRRGSDRFRSVCRIARVQRANDVGLWRVRNISDKGMMLAANVDVTVGEHLEISLSNSMKISGRVQWSKQGRCGVLLDEEIDVAATLAALVDEQHAECRRALRLPVVLEALVAQKDGTQPINLVDISQHGAGFSYYCQLAPGTELDLLFPSIEQRRHALVRWSRGLRGGLWFTSPLDRADLESVARLAS